MIEGVGGNGGSTISVVERTLLVTMTRSFRAEVHEKTVAFAGGADRFAINAVSGL
jgi:hypothetical protein